MRQPIKRTTAKKTVAAPARRRIISSASSRIDVAQKPEQSKGFLDRIISFCLIAIFAICPLFFIGSASQGIGFEKMILFYFLVLIGSVAYIAKGIIEGELKFKRTIFDWPILGLIITATVSTIASVGVKDSLLGAYGSFSKSLTALIIFILFYYLLVNNVNAQRIKTLFWSLIVSSSVITVYSLLQLFGFFILPFLDFTKFTNFNPIGSASNLSMFLVISTPLLFIGINQLGYAKKIVARTSLSIVLLLNIVTLIALKGFTFWPMIIVGAIVIVGFSFYGKLQIERSNLFIVLGVLLISSIFFVDNVYFKDIEADKSRFIPDNIFQLNVPVEVGLSRSASWDIAKSSLKERPVFGSGPSTFYYSFNKYKDIGLNKTSLWNISFDNTTGLFFESLVVLGVVGTLVIFVLLVIGTVLSFTSLLVLKDEENTSILLGLFTSFISIFVFSFIFSLNPASIIYAVLISFLCFSGALVFNEKELQVIKLTFQSKERYKLIAAFLVVCVVIITLIVLGCKMYFADVYAKKSIDASNIDDKITSLEKATKLGWYQDSYYIGLSNYYTLLFNQSAAKGDKDGAQSNLLKAIKLGEKAVGIAPNKSKNIQSLALLYESFYLYDRGALEKAESQYKKIIVLEPSNPTPYLRLGLIRMAQANSETEVEEKKYYINEAIKQYDEALKRKDNLTDVYQGKSIAYENLGDIDQAIQNLAQASTINPDNAVYRFELARLYFNKGIALSNVPQDTSGYTNEELRILQIRQSRGLIEPNNELKSAEQLFLSVLLENQKHANARYSLALLYQKIGDFEKAAIMVKSLLDILEDQSQIEAIKNQFPGLY